MGLSAVSATSQHALVRVRVVDALPKGCIALGGCMWRQLLVTYFQVHLVAFFPARTTNTAWQGGRRKGLDAS
jgi:hypothetical protein